MLLPPLTAMSITTWSDPALPPSKRTQLPQTGHRSLLPRALRTQLLCISGSRTVAPGVWHPVWLHTAWRGQSDSPLNPRAWDDASYTVRVEHFSLESNSVIHSFNSLFGSGLATAAENTSQQRFSPCLQGDHIRGQGS